MGALKDALIGTASYLPPVNNVFNQWRSFAYAKLPFCGLKNVCAISSDKNSKVPRVLIASADGFLYIYDLNVNEGGECTVIKQHKLDDSLTDQSPQTPGTSSSVPETVSFSPAGETSSRDPLPAPATCHMTIPTGPAAVSYASVVRGSDSHSRSTPSPSSPSQSPIDP